MVIFAQLVVYAPQPLGPKIGRPTSRGWQRVEHESARLRAAAIALSAGKFREWTDRDRSAARAEIGGRSVRCGRRLGALAG